MKNDLGKGPCQVNRWLRWGLVVLCLHGPFVGLFGQVVDENLSQSGRFVGVGEDSLDYIAQSFVADIYQVEAIGVWLEAESGEGGVKMSLVGNANGVPDLSAVLFESDLLRPAATGQFYIDSSFTNILTPADTYWVVVDGYQNLLSNGYAAVGASGQFTDTGAGMYLSGDGGQSWDSLAGVPLAIYVAGDTCTFTFATSPDFFALCPGTETEITAPPGFLAYNWSDGTTSRNLIVDSVGTYSVTVVDEDFCLGSGQALIIPDALPVVGLDSTYVLCAGGTVILPAAPFYSSYAWNNGATTFSNVVDAPGIYTVEVMTNSGCTARDTTEVVAVPGPTVDIGGDTSLCQGEFILLDAGSGFELYVWSNGATSRSIFVDADASVSVFVGDSIGCTATSDTIDIAVNPLPDTPQVSLDLDELLATFAFGYQWFGDGSEIAGATGQRFEPTETGFYQVEVTNAFGCRMRSDTFFLDVEPAGNFIPGGFSPNGDGVNDVFFIEAIDRFPNNLLVVFNRWGDEVFRKQGYNNDWQGTGKQGNDLPDADYFYVLDLGDGSPPRRGNVLIHR